MTVKPVPDGYHTVSPYLLLEDGDRATATVSMRSIRFDILPAPEVLRNDVECFRIAEYTGEEGLAIHVCLNGRPGIVFQHHQGRSPSSRRRAAYAG